VRRSSHALLLIVVVSRAWLSPALARAQTAARLELEWHAPSGCLDRETAQASIEQALGASGVARVPPAVVHVTIAAIDSERWDAEIWMYDANGSGERSVAGASCLQVAQATVLIVALALATGTAPEPEPATVRSTASSPPAALESRLRFGGVARLVGDVGSLPKPDLGLALGLAIQYRLARAEAELGAWLPRIAHDDLAADSGGRLFLYTGTLRGCIDVLNVSGGTFTLGPCLSSELGAMLGRGLGLALRRRHSVFWGASSLGLSARYFAADPLWFGLLAELGVPWHRASWRVDDVGTVFQPSALVGRMSIGVGWFFP
jgi:hypothetical protein